MPMFAWALIMLVASYAITSLTMKQQKVKPASLEEFDFPQADEGTPQSVVFGDVWTGGWMVLWYGNLRTIKIKSGGKK
jgi:hypothetical protein